MSLNGSGKRGQQLGKAALAKANTVSITFAGDYTAVKSKVTSMSQDMGITYDSNNNVTGNSIKSATVANTTHSTDTDNPHSVTSTQLGLGGGYTGNIDIVTSVDFVNSTTTTTTLTVTNGIITGVS